MSFPPSGISRTHNGLLSSWRERSGFDSPTSVNFFQVLSFFNRLGSFFCEDHYIHILKLRAPLPPPPLLKSRMNSIEFWLSLCFTLDLGGWGFDQRAKKVLSDSPGLVDFAIGLMNSVFNLPDGLVMFYEEFE